MTGDTLNLKAWRKHRKLSQEALADASGIERSHISKIETGRIGYNNRNLEDLAKALGCKVPDLYRDPSDGAEIIDILDRIDPRDRQKALEMLKVFTAR